MPEAADFLAVARLLSDAAASPMPGDARFRRAISTAYYALFHKITRVAADRFIGSDQEKMAGHILLRRAFDHRTMKTVCEALQAETLNERYRTRLGRNALSQDIRDFAVIFPNLQAVRHLADYDASVTFSAPEAASTIKMAEVAMAAFDRAAPDEQTDVLALMLVGART